MSRLAKFLWGLASLALAGGAGYYVLKSENVLSFAFPKTEFGQMLRGNFEKGREWVVEKFASLTAPLAEKAVSLTAPTVQKGEEFVSGALQKAKDQVGGAVEKAKLGAIDSVRKSLNEKFDDIVGPPDVALTPVSGGDTAPTAPTDAIAQIFPLGFSVKRGLPTVFVIKNVSGSGAQLAYQIFWGDGRGEVGSLSRSESKTLFHAWEATGEFLIKVVTGAGAGSKAYSSYIFVYP